MRSSVWWVLVAVWFATMYTVIALGKEGPKRWLLVWLWVLLVLTIIDMIKDTAKRNLVEPVKKPLSIEELTDEEKIAHNERVINNSVSDDRVWYRISPEDARHLIPHPTILCRFSRTPEQLAEGNYGVGWHLHGVQPAIWRRDMKYPECAKCIVENPYE